ncbi:class I SAM-dependent methyltransferase [Prosthecobacter dejongeii]|uniref:2-polyprenyl-3-methyl-5-hydroxy-6-metoxy-1, 4-benzoquinol methylase n=1 Tax=Prosthecobacter dejongeii TaxID=48465 RepID=A0A7W7YLC9_9BACT|nr:class I SAM-dependent methyltransferase [Prosthecobacter dejongeii]MBB5038341.1 2-polyprenyl-3-methyl-5-hydroxy-6-metoxy-1,4-benzoquinol methylase [Prosthecobacter dejongeii]
MRKLIETFWTPVACDVCGAEETGLSTLGTRIGRIIQKHHDYTWRHEDVQCTQCGFVFNRLRPTAEFLRDYYTDCWPIASTSIDIVPDFDVAVRLELLHRWLKPKARVYEIGDKLGEFHTALLKAGYDVAGDDVMAVDTERAEWLDGLFRRGCVAVPPTAMKQAFDAVLAYFVIEHLANPRDWLLSMRGLLTQDGVLVIEVPHLVRHPKEALMHEHFLYLTPESLTALVQEAGYEVVEIRETGASRAFGFSLVARRVEMSPPIALAPLQEQAAELQAAYQRGRALLNHAQDNLATSADLIIQGVDASDTPVRVCFFGANQTASEIATLIGPQLKQKAIKILPYDNSDVKTGTHLEGFEISVKKPDPSEFHPSVLHICVICSRGWTQAIASQIRQFGLPRFILVDGAAGELLPKH